MTVALRVAFAVHAGPTPVVAAARLRNRSSCKPFPLAGSIPEGTTRLPAGLMPWQGADHAKPMAGSGTRGRPTRHMYRYAGRCLCERTLSSPCARMSGDRAYLSDRRTSDRAAPDGASLAATGGRVRGQQRIPAPAHRERAAGHAAATADSVQGRRQESVNRRAWRPHPRCGACDGADPAKCLRCGRVPFSGVSRNKFMRARRRPC